MNKPMLILTVCADLAACGSSARSVTAAPDKETDTAPAVKNTASVPVFDFATRTVTLNSGHKMPIIGIGRFTLTAEETENTVLTALKEGYRLIDTAHMYGNEEAVGRAVRKSGIAEKTRQKPRAGDFAPAPAKRLYHHPPVPETPNTSKKTSIFSISSRICRRYGAD